MFENSSDKLYAVAFSALGISITTPMLFSIIWFERNNHHRTLINQLVSSIIWYAIIWNATLQFPTILRYLLGPFPPVLCYIDIIFRNSFTMQGLLYLTAIIIVRYVFLFHLKNPTALQVCNSTFMFMATQELKSRSFFYIIFCK